jgi:integrase
MAKYSNSTAFVELITLTLLHIAVSPWDVSYGIPFSRDKRRQENYVVKGFPILRWATGALWDEANIWLAGIAQSIPVKDVSIKTIRSLAYALLTFMRFVELGDRAWNYLPMIPADRTINRYRKHLIDLRNDHEIAASTTSAKMSVVLRLFRWAQANEIISPLPFERATKKVLKIPDRYGRDMTISIDFSNLSIPNRKASVDRLEDGLMPVSREYRDDLLEFANTQMSREFYLMLRVAFESGLRIESICDLKLKTIEWAMRDQFETSIYWLQVGPDVDGAPVSTKYRVNGTVMITADLLQDLKEYATSSRRILREGRTPPQNRSLLFITGMGNSYGRRENMDGSAINSLVYDMKQKATMSGLNFDDFHFHRARATFGVSIVQCGIDCGIRLSDVIPFARDCMLHRHVETTMLYVKFLQNSKIKEKYANEFTKLMMGNFGKRLK